MNLSTYPTTIDYESTIGAQITLFNSLDGNLSLGANFPANSSIQSWNGYDFFCGENNFLPMLGYALFQGYYSQSNITTAGAPLQLAPSVNIGCVTYPKPTSIVFLPESDTAVLYSPAWSTGYQEPATTTASTQSCVASSTGAWLCGGSEGLTGYWNTTTPMTEQNATIGSKFFSYFSPGLYTLAVEDIWNQTIYAHFQVTPASTTTTTSIQCTVSGEGTGLYVTVLSDSGQRIQGAQVTGTVVTEIDSSTCQQDIGTYVTNSTGTVVITQNAGSYYQLSIAYQGISYSVKAPIAPMETIYVRLMVPSGNVTISQVFEGGCQTSSGGVTCP